MKDGKRRAFCFLWRGWCAKAGFGEAVLESDECSDSRSRRGKLVVELASSYLKAVYIGDTGLRAVAGTDCGASAMGPPWCIMLVATIVYSESVERLQVCN